MSNSNKIIIVTGGAGFVGSNLISLLINKTKFKIIKRGFQKSDVFKTHGQNAKINKNVKFKKYKDANFALLNTIEWYKKNHRLLR